MLPSWWCRDHLWKGRLSFGTEEMFTNRRNDFTQSGFSADAFNHIRQSIYAGFLEYYLTSDT